jgi:DNA-binding HxlR family transcriptional regulator
MLLREVSDAMPSYTTTDTDRLERLSALVHHRWTLPILAELYRDDGCKFVTLVNRLSVSRDSLSRTLEHLQTLGLAVKNPGYGHPLRPEYVLTPSGQLIGSDALELMNHLHDLGITEVALKKWSLPVTLAVHTGFERFSTLLEVFPGLTSRALTLALRDLETSGLIQREADSTYGLTPSGTRVAGALEQLELEIG